VQNEALVPEAASGSAVARGRIGFGLTRRALLLLLAGLLFLFPAFFIRPFVWATLAWDVALLLLAAFDFRSLPFPGSLRVQRTWLSVPSQGVETSVELSCTHDAKLALHCTLVDDLAPALSLEPLEVELAAHPHATATAPYTFRPRERGNQVAGRVFLRYRSRAGLITRWAQADLTQTVRVYPHRRRSDAGELFLARMRQVEQQLRRQRLRGLGRDFESLRDYREGDDMRDICWTASARRGSFITRQYQVEKSQPVWIVVDTGRLLQTQVRISTKLDYAASTALALAQLALHGGDRVGLLTYGRDIQQRVPLGRGSAHLAKLIDALALTRGQLAESDHLKASITFNRLQSRRSLVLWITDLAETAMTPEVVEGASLIMRRQHLLLFVVMRNDQLLQSATTPPDTTADMYRRAAALDLLHRRESLLARLRERGAFALETTPGEMTSVVLNKYLDVKERALI
jgi:uncharacterized protein (DUF58 family)